MLKYHSEELDKNHSPIKTMATAIPNASAASCELPPEVVACLKNARYVGFPSYLLLLIWL